MAQDKKTPLYTLYESLKTDNYDVPDTYESFERTLTASGNEGTINRMTLYNSLKENDYDVPDTYESFANTLFAPASTPEPKRSVTTTETQNPPKESRYFKLRRGGKDFTVSTDEVNAAGGLTGWAKANPGAPLRVYMQGKKEDGTDFNGHVDLSVAHDRSKERGYKYTTTREAVKDKPWRPTEQDKIAMSHQVHQMQAQTDAMFAESRERMDNASEYNRSNRGLGFHTVEGKPMFNPETGKMEKSYLTPTGDRTTDKVAADMSTFNFRQTADMSVGAQIRRAEAELAELREKYKESASRVYGEWEEDYKKNGAPLAAVLAGNTYTPRQMSDKENSALRVAIRQREEQLKNLYEERDRQMGKDVGFWRGFGRTVGDIRTWDFGTGDLLDAMTMMNADKYSSPDATEGEKRAGQEMLKAVSDAQQTEQMFGGNASFWNRAGVMTGYMPSFMLDFALTGGGFEVIGVASKAATRGAVKVVGKEALKEMTELGVKAYAKKYGVRGVGRMAENWTIKALGTTADDLLIRAPLMTNTVQAGKTTADIIDRKLGDVVVDENGNYDFSNDKTWGSAIWQGEANAIIENYSEMFGAHLDGVGQALAKTFGGKRISGMLARANASSYGQILATTRKQFERMGVSDYFGEVSEEYYGQLWRSMLNLDDAYTNVPVLDEQGNQTLDSDGNPVYERKNLLFTGQFHGDIWGGMALSMGLMGAGKYTITGIAYGNMKHQVNVADRVAAEIFTTDRWEPIREIIDNTTNEDMGVLADSMVNDTNLSDEERSAVMNYMERSLNLRGLNLGTMVRSRGVGANTYEQSLNESYIDGYEAVSAQEKTDAQNMYDVQRKRVEGMFDTDDITEIENNPVITMREMAKNGLYTQEERDAVRDYINAKTLLDGIKQRVSDDISEQIAQIDARINACVNNTTGMIHPAVMEGAVDKAVYIVDGNIVLSDDGVIDHKASDNTLIVRDAQTGHLYFADSKSIISVDEVMDPQIELAVAEDNIRKQVEQDAANAMVGILDFNPGDVVKINDGDGLIDVTIVGPLVDEESGMPVDNQIIVQFSDGTQKVFEKEQLQKFANAANLERVNVFEQERATRARQQVTETETIRPQFALNDEFTILNETGTPIRGSITGELDEDGTVEIYTEEPINGNRVNRFTPAELEEMFDTYNGEAVALPVPENVETVPNIEETPENGGEISDNPAETVPNPDEAAQAEPQASALSRVPIDEQGQPKYDETDPDTAWDAIVEQAQGDEATAAEVVADIVSERQDDFNAAEKALNKTKEGKPEKRKKGDPAPTMEERIAAKNAAKQALAEAQAIRDQAKAALDHWKKIASTKQRREVERRSAEDAEARRRAEERAAEEARLKAEREEAERIEREALNGVPDWAVDTPADSRARGYRRNGPQKVDRPEIIDNHAIGNAVEVKFGDDVMPTGNVVVIEASQLQPSHRDGQRNPAHFLDEAQPKERKDAASRFAAAKIAEGMRPEEITSSVTAFTGAPSINARGEVIQGNNRSEALRLMYENYAESAERYKQYLIEHAAEFGLTPEAIAAFEQPVLVNMLDVSDENAITLGQYVAQDTESGGIERVKPKNAVQKMGDKIRNFANLLLRSADDEATFAQLVDANGVEVLKWMNQQGFITNTQYASAFDSKGNLSAEAANDLKGIMYQSIFTGGSTRLEEMFNKMPAKAQRAILATAFRDYDSAFADRMISEIQQSIIAFDALMGFEQFRDASNAEATQNAVEAWKKQYAFDDVSGEPYLPSETFSNFALALAAMYKGHTQRHIQTIFNMMYDIVQGTEQDNLFEAADKTPKPLAEAIRRVLNLEYQPVTKPTTDNGTNGSAVLDVNSEYCQDGRHGSDGNADGAEQSQEEAKPTDGGTGAASNSGQGGELATKEEIEAIIASMKAKAQIVPFVEITEKNWRKNITTPLGVVKMGENQKEKLFAKGREFQYGMLLETLGSPDIILEEADKQDNIFHERPSSYLFIKTFQKEDGSKYVHFESVTVSQEGMEVSISSHIIRENQLRNKMKSDRLLYKATALDDSANSSAEQPINQGGSLSSDGKGNTLSTYKQGIDSKSSLEGLVKAAEAEVNTDPTPAQKEAGNYKKGHIRVGTFDVTIEQPVGSVRCGKSADGKEWETTMQNTYGYIRGTESVDGDHIDVFLSTDIDAWNGRRVVIVDQYNPDGSFDEHKVMLGFNDKAAAINAYLANYENGWEKGRRLVFSSATLEDFEKWIESSHRKQKPYHKYKIAEKAEVDESTPENPVSATYTIDTYTTKKNKTYHRVVFPRADKAVWQERLNLAKKMGGTSIPKGYGFKTQEEAEAFAKVIADPAAVADAQPLSLDDMRSSIEEAPTATATEAEQVTETETQQPEADKPVNPSGNKLVTDERYLELRERMRKKLGGQLNMGVDPEILAIGTEMAVYHIEKGARKFKAYASAMIADLGDAIRPYLKSFYNAVRDMPEAAGLVADMDSYDEVRSVDIANFDKPSTDVLATAAAVVAEQEAEKEREEAEAKLKEKRKKRTNPDGSTTETVVESGTEIEITSGDFIPGVRPAIDEQKPGKKKSGKTKPTTDGGLFDTIEVPALVVPEQRPATDLIGDSTAFQEREAQTAELVEEIGGVIESRVAMLQLDAESVKPLTMTDVKKMASKYPALKDISDTDLQELVELAMTQLTRSEALINIDGTAEAQRRAYDHIVDLYHIQPSLNARDSERLIKQQYSTPTPFGFVMGQFVRAGGKTVGSMFEPSAGNGALTITVHPSVIHVNDIDDARLANLRKLGYGQVTAQDALLPFSGDKVDVVMTNPPFGTITEKVYDGVFRISSLEGQMAINALEQMKDDGRAAIVIGGNTSYRTNGSMSPKDAAFFGYLYSHYNVADVINISGKALYSRNGTGYDVRMILIDGRKTGEFQRVFPPVKAKARAEQVTTFDELYKRVQDDIQQIQQVGSQSADVQREPEATTDGTASAPVRSGNNRPNTGAGQRPGTTSDAVRDTPRIDSGQPTSGNDGSRPAGVDNADSGNAGSTDNVSQPKPQQPRSVGGGSAQDGTGRSGSNGRGTVAPRPDRSAERLAVKPDLITEKVPYPNQSENGFTLMSVVPAAQAQVLQKSLGEIGDVDQYLVDELGYSSKEELYSYLAAEQIDSVALAIHQMNKGNAFIIGDMTGVGKGRQGAALIRYAVKQGKVPIYFTQKSTLFTDNYRDLADIGSSDLRPFIIASNPKDANIVDTDGNVVHKLPSKKEQERVFNYIMEHGTLPDEYDYVLTTYDQIKNGTADYTQNEDGIWNTEARKLPKKSKGYTTADNNGQARRDALAQLAEGNIAILDESHTVGGDSGCGRYMQMLTSSAEGVTFLSATFAKRADNMPIYAQRTAIAEAGVKASELIDAISKGGVTLQEIMSKQLVESGQMIRRERSFEGVTIDWLSVEEETNRRQREQFNEVADIFNAIRNFQDDYITPIIDAKNEAAAEFGATVGHTQGTKDLGVKNVPFASKMYNLVNQLLFALKVDAVADRVVENLRNGYKPVISFTNTMEGFLSSAPKGVAMDDVPNFSLTLMRALDGVMRFTEKDADENTDGGSISLSDLSTEGQNAYNAIREKIINLSADLPISPMDAIRMKIEEVGYSVAEITGRTMQLNRTEDGRYIVEARKDRDKKAAMRDFNSGKLDVLMINKSGSTGISLHASSKFEDQRPRVMVFAQFQSDINDEVQMRGRIDRSGQVTRGRYEYIMSTIPAEQRIQMMFKAKLKSLDANTTSSQKSKFNEMEIVDYLNKYGDEVVWEYMKEHPELEERLGDPLDMLQEKNSEDGPRTSEKEDTSKKTGCAGKISRYLAFLSVEEQDEIFREITEAYRVKIQLLDDAGENDLEITTMPLRAEIKQKKIWHEGENPGSGNAFADNTYVEEVEVDVLKKPMKRDEIVEATRKLMGERYIEKNGGVDWQHYVRAKGDEISLFFQSKADEAIGKLKEAGEARIAKAREKAVAAATKARGRGENNFTDEQIQSLADTVANEEREKELQKQRKRQEEIMAIKHRIQSLLQRLRAGSIYVVPQDLKQGTPEMFTQTFGTFVGFKFNKGYTLGSSTAIFATLDGRRKVELALSDQAINTIISATDIANRYSPDEIRAISLENWDSKVPTQTRQKRYIITGNLLQALVDTEKGDKTRGNLISFSTIDGETRQGILMGENFKLTDLRNSASLSSRLAQIRDGKTIVSENGDVQIDKISFGWQHRGQYELRVPKSKQRGGVYTMHPDLLKLVEDNNFITKGNNMVAYVTEENIANVIDMLSHSPFNLTVLQESQLTDAEILERQGDGYGAYSDAEVSYMNDPVSKVMGKSRFSKKQQAVFAARERQHMADRIQKLAELMHLDNVEIVTDASQLEGKQAKAKGFYNKRTGQITIVISNNVSTIDAEQTLLHEAVAHYGLRQLFGEQFNTFLDNVYQSADESIRRKITEMAAKNGWNFRTATEEYLAGLAEDTNFNEARSYGSWWSEIKRLFLDMLEKIGLEGFRDKAGVVLTDNELRYILWRSYENLAEPGRYRSIFGEAADVAKQSELKVGNYAEYGIEAEYAAEPYNVAGVNERFNEQLARLNEGNADKVVLMLGRPSSVLLAGGVTDKPMKLYGNKVIKKMKKHGFELSELKDLPMAVAHPIGIFDNLGRVGNRSILTELKTKKGNVLVTIDLGKGGDDIDFNIVSSVFGKGEDNVVDWIERGLPTYINKRKALNYLHHSALRAEALSSSRLESAANIVNSFENPTIEDEELFRPGDFSPRDRATARDEYNRICASGSYQFQEAVQDSMLGLKKLYQAILGKETRIEDVPGFENAYLFENRMSSMNAGEQHEYFQRYMQPLMKEIGRIVGANKRKRRELTDYIMAKHGLERNEYMRNEAAANGEDTDRDFAGLMGLTGEADWRSAEATAKQWVYDNERMVDTTALWEAINKATKATLEKVYLSGVISKETYERILGMYDYYIPLRGWDATTSEQVYGYLTSNDGPLGGSIMKKADGRESKADDPIATIGMMADDAIRQGNRNLMKQRFLNFVLNHPSDLVSLSDLWLEYNKVTNEWEPVFADVKNTDTADEVAQKVEAFEQRMEALRTAEPDMYKKGRDAQHIPYKVVRGNLREHQILIKRGSRTFVATINGNPRAAQAINGLTNPDVDQNGVVGNMLKLGTWVNRQLSAFYTTRNPDFVVGNFFRDMLYSNCMTWVKESPRYALCFHKNFGLVNPIVMRRLLGKWETGKLNMSNRTESLFYQFMMNGGETGYTNVRDIEGYKKAVATELKKQKNIGRKVWSALGMQLDLLNRSAENCARFAAFVTSREFGRSIDRSIYDAKEVSVNFNKKGSGGKMVNANGQTALGKAGSYLGGGGRLLYVFWNAGVQGMTNFGRQAKLHPAKFSAGAAAFFTLGYVIPLLAQMLGVGDGDDDDKNAYYNLPEYVRRSNICFYAGDQWITIPLPIEFRAMYGLGELAHGVISGNERYSNEELGYQIASQISQIMPLDMLEGGGGISPFIPSAAKPFTEAYIMNKSWTGLPVYKDTPFNKNDPEWTKAYASTDTHLVDFAKWLNETSGGDDFKKGYIDINPAKIEYLLNGTFGGLFTFPNKAKKAIETATGNRDFEWRNMPIANRLIKSGDERTANRKLTNEYFKYKEEYEETGRLMRKYQNATGEGVLGYAEKVSFLQNSPTYARWQIFDEFKFDMDSYREAIASETDEKSKAELEAEYYAIMRKLVNALHNPDKYIKETVTNR